MTESSSAFRLPSSLSTEIQRRYEVSEEQARKAASDLEFALYVQSSLTASSSSTTLIDELKAATKELEELLNQKSTG